MNVPDNYLERGLDSYGYPRMACDNCHIRPYDSAFNKTDFSKLAKAIPLTQHPFVIHVCDKCWEELK